MFPLNGCVGDQRGRFGGTESGTGRVIFLSTPRQSERGKVFGSSMRRMEPAVGGRGQLRRTHRVNPSNPESERRIIVPRDDLPASRTAPMNPAEEQRLCPAIVRRAPCEHVRRIILPIECGGQA